MSDPNNTFDKAKENCLEINSLLADTDGAIAEMAFSGAIGHHVFIAEGETNPEYLSKVALLQALEDTVLEMVYIDADNPATARNQLENQLSAFFNPNVLSQIADNYESNLCSMIDVREADEQ